MFILRDLTIKQKLLAITMVTIAVSLLLAGIGIVISDSILFRSGMQRDLSALASIVGDNSTAALAFDDPRVASETLNALRARPHMAVACIYKTEGPVFARYAQPGSDRACPPPEQNEEARFIGGELIASHPIFLTGRRVGTLVMVYDLGEAVDRRRLYIGIVLIIFFTSSVIAFAFSSSLRQILTMPISSLAQAAASVSQTGNYGVRVEKYSQDEVGVLVDSFNDMLARVQSRDLQVQNARYSLETTLTSIGDAVISTDTAGHIVFANPVARSLLRKTEGDLTGRPIDEVFQIIDETDRTKLENPVHKVLREGNIVKAINPTVLIGADGTEFPVDNSAAPIRGANGELMGVVLTFRDISNRRATEKLLVAQAEELRQTAQLLKDADEKKDQFLAMLAHELRNPLAPIRNAVQVLKLMGSRNPKEQRAGDIIERQTQHLARLVDDLLDVSRITRGKVTLQQERVPVSTIIERAVETSRPLIDARKHHLNISLPREALYVRGDLTRLVQVVGNMLNNAAKFTDEGGSIRLQVEHEDGHVVIRVIDNGIGIPRDLLPQVFDLFTQADRSLDRTQGGLGIGLTLVRNLVELHGGRVEVRSEGLGRGSEFVVRLPAFAAPVAGDGAVSRDGHQPAAAVPLRILVVDDNVDSAEMLDVMLRLYGHDVWMAHDGVAAIKAAQEFKPQIILCDIGLPGMSGYDVASKLRAMSQFEQTRLIALSGYGQDEDRLRSRNAGFDYHITKPVEPEELTALLASLKVTAF
jgi:PAS domain S-box-containing protein